MDVVGGFNLRFEVENAARFLQDSFGVKLGQHGLRGRGEELEMQWCDAKCDWCYIVMVCC